MKRVYMVLLLMLAAWLPAEADMRIFAAEGALDAQTAQQLAALLEQAFDQAEWTLEMEGEESLRTLVMEDHAPHIAICSPADAYVWAREGLLQPLGGAIAGQQRMEEAVLSCCVYDESLFMAPLLARHRRIAVSRRLFEAQRMGYLLSGVEYPVWYTSQFHQIMEEFMLDDIHTFDVWPPDEQNAAGMEALVQAIFDGALLTQDGERSLADSPEIRAGVKWLMQMMENDMVGYAGDRGEALERFIEGQTPVFIDWTDREERAYAAARAAQEIVVMPYPCSTGTHVRAFDVIGASAFAHEDKAENELAVRAIAFLNEDARAQKLLGSRMIYSDDARWLPCLGTGGLSTTMRCQFAKALHAVMEQGADADTALTVLQAVMEEADG